MAWEKLTTTNIVQLIGGIGAVVVSVIIGFLVNDSLKADLRYEEGQYYRSGGEAVVSLKLKNYGRSDAKDIIISTGFPKALVKSPTTSDDTYPCTVVAGGGKGEEAVSVSVKRLVPDQTLYVYYVIADAKKAMASDKANFVSGVTFEGGQGKTGEPIPLSFILAVIVTICFTAASLVVMYWRFRKRWERMDQEAKEREEEWKRCEAIWEERMQRRQEVRQKQEKERQEAIQALITERDDLRKKLEEAGQGQKRRERKKTCPAPQNS
ncbi:MAG: hypothetical protein HYS12_01900 [Planctomycetes bacterium]|nr:hypothetical protein [Planctomycetota bacterium]